MKKEKEARNGPFKKLYLTLCEVPSFIKQSLCIPSAFYYPESDKYCNW